jgi:hypothetical protein
MSAALGDMAAWLAVVLTFGVAVLALAMLRARSLFITAAAVAAMSALAAGAVLLLGGGDGVVALAAFGVGVAPLVLMGAALLSSRTAKGGRGGLIAHGIGVAAAVAGAVLIAPEWTERAPSDAAQAPTPLWLSVLIFVAATACVVVLAFGERGALDRNERGPDL